MMASWEQARASARCASELGSMSLKPRTDDVAWMTEEIAAVTAYTDARSDELSCGIFDDEEAAAVE